MKKILRDILAELKWANACRYHQMTEQESQGITPPPGTPPGDEPDN